MLAPALHPESVGPLVDLDTRSTPGYSGDKSDGTRFLTERGDKLSTLQEMLYANGRTGDPRSVLLVLQGMDTSGKGGIVKHVLGMVDPQGVSHSVFGPPTDEELEHDFLWRIRKKLPAAGQLGVFDRSHYEDVLVVRVHELVEQEEWERRYDAINEFEEEVVAGGTAVVKVVLAISHDEQRSRLAKRLNRPDKYWKYSPDDITERRFWHSYQEAYQAVLDRTSTPHAPWHVVPADRKWFARLAVTELLIETLDRLELTWPAPDFDVEEQKLRLAES
ncbi:PPK2 family polyphosphate kinase [Williamsia sterculiae]|nr:PPK2 family polyphosphate kinase [Williamsia sterculiae]